MRTLLARPVDAIFKNMSAQINMDIDNMVLPTSDGKKYVREFNDSSGGELWHSPHNVIGKMKVKLETCRNKHGVFTWKRTFQEFAKVIDRQMNGKVDNVAQICVSLSFQGFYTEMERQKAGLSSKKKFTPPSVVHLRMLISFLKKNQTCYGGILSILLLECHANQSTWSELDKDLFDRVRQFLLELVRSFGLQAHKALSLANNLLVGFVDMVDRAGCCKECFSLRKA